MQKGEKMTKQEIIKFNMSSGEEQRECAVPFSLSTSEGKELSRGSFTSSFFVAVGATELKFAYIRITDAVGLTEVRIGGEVVFEGCFSGRVLNINAKGKIREGEENELTLVFSQIDGYHLAAGLFGKAELIRFGGAIIDRVEVSQTVDSGAATLSVSLDMLGNSDYVRAVATLVSSSGQIFYGGITRGRGTITVKDPLYWWPKDMGVQNLYKLTVNLYGDTEIEDTVELKVGIRRVSATDGKATFDILGASFLPMGAVYTPERRADPHLSKMRETAFLNSAARVGINALVVQGDDILPDDNFFELCDAHGIAVIREIKASLLENNSEELELLARIGHHPSMMLYQIIHDSGNATKIKERILKVASGVAVRVMDKPVKYKRFASLPSDRALSELVPSGERNLFSRSMENLGRYEILDMIKSCSERYPYAGGFDEFAYISSVSAARRTSEAVIEARLGRGDLPAIYDGLGDTAAGICYSGMDSTATWRATQYEAARFFAPLYLHPEYLGDGRVVFYISNERRQTFAGSIEYRIGAADNSTVHKGSANVVVERNSARLVLERDFGEFLIGHEDEYYLECYLKDQLGTYAKASALFVPEKHFKFKDPKISYEIVGSERRFSITLVASAFAGAVEISLGKHSAVLYDNYFDITTGAPLRVSFTLTGGMSTAEELSECVKIRSIYDLIGE